MNEWSTTFLAFFEQHSPWNPSLLFWLLSGLFGWYGGAGGSQKLLVLQVGPSEYSALVRGMAATVLARVIFLNSAFFAAFITSAPVQQLLGEQSAQHGGQPPFVLFLDSWLELVNSPTTSAFTHPLSFQKECLLCQNEPLHGCAPSTPVTFVSSLLSKESSWWHNGPQPVRTSTLLTLCVVNAVLCLFPSFSPSPAPSVASRMSFMPCRCLFFLSCPFSVGRWTLCPWLPRGSCLRWRCALCCQCGSKWCWIAWSSSSGELATAFASSMFSL